MILGDTRNCERSEYLKLDLANLCSDPVLQKQCLAHYSVPHAVF